MVFLDKYETMIQELRKINTELFGESSKPSFADKTFTIISLIAYTIVWWILMIPIAIVGGIFKAIRDLIDKMIEV